MSISLDIKEYLKSFDIDFDLDFESNKNQIFEEIINGFDLDIDNEEKNCLFYTINVYLDRELKLLYKYNDNIDKVNSLKELDLPDQRTPEWYEMRKNKLTASSFADALGKGHFKTRNQSLLDKIIDQPFEPNPITEWGTKYEEVATRFYEYLTGASIYEFGLIPHSEFPAFGASPDGICDTNSPLHLIGRMLEIKCPPKRKFTKAVPPHYMMQMQGQLEVCDLEECDFLQVELKEYINFDDYKSDIHENYDKFGFTKDNFPKGYTITYIKESNPNKFHYLYCPLFSSNSMIEIWKDEKMDFLKNNNFKFHEEKFWKIVRYECTLVTRNKAWWNENVENIYNYYKDLLFYKKDNNIEILKKKVDGEKGKKIYYIKEDNIDDFCLISDEEDNTNSS